MAEPLESIGRVGLPEPLRRVWPAQARHLAALRSELRRWVAPLALTEDAEDDLVLASSEAASNCIEHAYRPTTVDDIVEVRYWTDAQAVFVEIIDHGRWQTPSGRSTGRGRGIGIMQRLMAGVEIHHDTRGTRVLLYQPLPDGRVYGAGTAPPSA
jgi:serine/threonine-protein kinase RsbW